MGARSAAASVVRHVGGVAAEATLVAALVATLALAFSPVYAPAKFLAGTDNALAARGGNNGTTSGSCSVAPDPVAAGSSYTISVSGLKPNHMLNVDVSNSIGTTVFTRYSDSSGTTSVTWYAGAIGTNGVSVYDVSSRKPALVASCAFLVD